MKDDQEFIWLHELVVLRRIEMWKWSSFCELPLYGDLDQVFRLLMDLFCSGRGTVGGYRNGIMIKILL